MIIEKPEFTEGQKVDTDICIIGGGPAAISIALALNGINKKVAVLTGGKWFETAFNQDLHKGLVAEGSSHEPLELYRRRQFGGGTVIWGGRCIPFEPIDFEKRDWVNESGWPFKYEDLLPFYRQAAELVKIGKFDFDVHDIKRPEIVQGMDDEYLISTHIEKWSPPVNFAREYESKLSSSKNITVYLDTHAVNIKTENDADSVSHIEAYCNGIKFTVTAGQFILAAGGLENPRLLLASGSINHPSGIGNTNDNVGRYYMAHYIGVYAELCFNDPKNVVTWFERDRDGVYFRRRWWLTEKAQEEQKLGNTIFLLDNPSDQHGHMVPHFSGIIVAKALRSVIRQKSFNSAKLKLKEVAPSFKRHSFNLLTKGWRGIPDLIVKGFKRLPKRRMPIVLPPKNNKYWGLFFQAEQTPYRDSRVTVNTSEKDPLGVPRLVADVKINPADIESIVKSHNIFISRFQKSNAGSFIYTEEGLRNYLDMLFGSFSSVAHHIGTTRMSVSETNGVVDENAKVHGMKNLYIAGASVFPTGGHANPTLTIIAQSLKLAEHIKKNI